MSVCFSGSLRHILVFNCYYSCLFYVVLDDGDDSSFTGDAENYHSVGMVNRKLISVVVVDDTVAKQTSFHQRIL